MEKKFSRRLQDSDQYQYKLTPEQILKFRDEAYLKYHTNPKFLEKVKNTYGDVAVNNILENTKIKLKRKILGD